jgi:ATP-dependent Clp protease adaptor protein ClpS
MIKEKSSPSGSGSESLSELKDLVLFNDDVNTFDDVIEALVEVCKHELLQAEQCALIAHYKGKCSVRSGSFDELKPLHEAMSSRNLTVEIF